MKYSDSVDKTNFFSRPRWFYIMFGFLSGMMIIFGVTDVIVYKKPLFNSFLLLSPVLSFSAGLLGLVASIKGYKIRTYAVRRAD